MTDIQQATMFGDVVVVAAPASRDMLADQLTACFAGATAQDIAAMLTNVFESVVEYDVLRRGGNAGQKISLLFNPHRLETAIGGRGTGKRLRKERSKTLVSAFSDPKWCAGLARAVLWKGSGGKGQRIDLLYKAIETGVNGVQYINEFPPYLARDILKKYQIPADGAVLDPCAGWGGRMLGTSVVARRYVAYEPSTRTHAGLLKLADFIKLAQPNFDVSVRCQPYEESICSEKFDIALTSPPYYDTEWYADEDTQSCVRYATYDEWVDGFFRPLIDLTMARLKPGAPFIINIGSRLYPIEATLCNLFDERYAIREVALARLAGVAGLGKEGSRGERFYEVRNVD